MMKHIYRKSIPKGYQFDSETKYKLKNLQESSLKESLIAVASDYVAIYVTAYVLVTAYTSNLPTLPLSTLWLAGLVIIARSLRALEVLVHEGSHYNLSQNKKINDVVTCLFAAWPSFYLLTPYRQYHRPHHQEFGKEGDTDRVRFLEMGFDTLERMKPIKFLLQLAALYPKYIASWYQAIGSSPWVLVAGLSTHFTLYVVPLWLMAKGLAAGIVFWLVLIILPSATILPAIRLVAETSEHDYRESTIFDCSFTNNGLVHWYFHPHNDGLHLLHHLLPSIPHNNLKKAQLLVEELESQNFQSRQRRRTSLFEEPSLL